MFWTWIAGSASPLEGFFWGTFWDLSTIWNIGETGDIHFYHTCYQLSHPCFEKCNLNVITKVAILHNFWGNMDLLLILQFFTNLKMFVRLAPAYFGEACQGKLNVVRHTGDTLYRLKVVWDRSYKKLQLKDWSWFGAIKEITPWF